MKRRSTGSSSRAERGAPSLPPIRGPVPRTLPEVERILELLEVEPTKARGQNFLLDPEVADREAALLDLPPGSRVVEIGGGLGHLTRALLDRGFEVTVIEKEPRLAAYLAVNFEGRLRVLPGDARTLPLPPAPAYVGNLPFAVAGEILERLVAAGMEHGAFLVQREVAERIASPPGHRAYGRSTVLFRVDGEFRLAGNVPARSFVPVPKVDGALVVWRRDPLEPPPRERLTLELLLEAAFQHRRKVLGPTLPSGVERRFPLGRDELARRVARAGWPAGWERQRAEEVPPELYVALANELPAPRAPSASSSGSPRDARTTRRPR